MRDKEDSRCDKSRSSRGVQTAPASVCCLRKNWWVLPLHQCTKHPQHICRGRTVPTLSESCASKVGTTELLLQHPASPPPSSQVMGANPSELEYSSQAAQVAAAKSMTGEFAWNSGLWLNPGFQLSKHLVSSSVSISHFLPIFGGVGPSNTCWHYAKQPC